MISRQCVVTPEVTERDWVTPRYSTFPGWIDRRIAWAATRLIEAVRW